MASPIKDGKITTPFGKKGNMWRTGSHTGVDYAVPQGTDVLAAANGLILKASWGAPFGIHLIQKVEGQKVWVIYAHLSKSLVKPGMTVVKGQHIGESGNSGNSSGPHLHFEARTHATYKLGTALDPEAIILL